MIKICIIFIICIICIISFTSKENSTTGEQRLGNGGGVGWGSKRGENEGGKREWWRRGGRRQSLCISPILWNVFLTFWNLFLILGSSERWQGRWGRRQRLCETSVNKEKEGQVDWGGSCSGSRICKREEISTHVENKCGRCWIGNHWNQYSLKHL